MNATLWCRRSASLSFSVGSARAPGGPGHPGSRGDAVQAGGGSRHPACPSGSPGRAEPPVISRAMPRSTRASIALLAVGKLRPLNSLSCLGLVSGRWRRACREPASANGGSGRILPGPPAHSREWLFPRIRPLTTCVAVGAIPPWTQTAPPRVGKWTESQFARLLPRLLNRPRISYISKFMVRNGQPRQPRW